MKILYFDIETAPETAYIWKRYDTSVGQSQILEPGYLLCISWAWNDEEPQTLGLFGSRSWKRGDRRNDEALVKKAHELFSQADIIIGHNVKRFDVATLNARFVKYNLPPPAPFKIVDTLSILKKHFQMPSRSLESASHYFNIDIKEKQPFSLWKNCMDGLPEAWDRLLTYCAHDVTVVRQLYYKIRPFASTHPNMGLYNTEKKIACTKCGCEELKESGTSLTSTAEYTQYQCKKCGGWSKNRKAKQKSHIPLIGGL